VLFRSLRICCRSKGMIGARRAIGLGVGVSRAANLVLGQPAEALICSNKIMGIRMIHSTHASDAYDMIPDVKFAVQHMSLRFPDLGTDQIAKRLGISQMEADAILNPLPEAFRYPPKREPALVPHIPLVETEKATAASKAALRRFRFVFTEVGKHVDNKTRRIVVRDVNDELRQPTFDEYRVAMLKHETFQTRMKRRRMHQEQIQGLIRKDSPLVMTEFDEYEERRSGWRIGGLSPPIALEPETAQNMANVSKMMDDVLDLWEDYIEDPEYDSDEDKDEYIPEDIKQ